MIKKLGYRLFGVMFTLFRVFPLNKDKVFYVASHDAGPEGNIGMTIRALRKQKPELRVAGMTGRDGISRPLSFFFGKTYHMATAGIILLDNMFMPMAYTPISKKAKVIQLWHGTGTIKKFGLDSDPEEVVRIARKGNRRLSALIVNGEKTKEQYRTAFGVSEDVIRILGLPRTDLILNKKKMGALKERFFAQFEKNVPGCAGKRYVLYAPTFRDSEKEEEKPELHMDIDCVMSSFPEDVILLLRFHPAIAGKMDLSEKIPSKWKTRVFDMSGFSGVTTLLSVADVLITDYSSIIFEYALFERPMVFFAYDLESFISDGRDFYEPYESVVPGEIVQDTEGLVRELSKVLCPGSNDGKSENTPERTKLFLQNNYSYRDGRATERLVKLLLKE